MTHCTVEQYQLWNNAEKILRRLEGAGYTAFVVGGYVRDTFLGLEPKDADITTSATPDQVAELFPSAKVLHPTQAFPVVVVDGIEVATYRLDRDAAGRQSVRVEYTDSYEEDAQRRDFTCNALYMSANGTVHDPTGEGVQDLTDGVLRFVGDPYKRLREDPLRALRAVRFANRFGFTYEKRTEAALRRFGAGSLHAPLPPAM